MTIAGFNISKKQAIIGVCVIGGIIAIAKISDSYNNYKLEKEHEEEMAAEEAANAAASDQVEEYDYETQMQAELVEEYGEPPEGFKWDLMGNLVALSSDDKTAEDVLFSFVRSISILDFATAQKNAESSQIYDTYTGYFNELSSELTDYYSQFLRKEYTLALKSIEIDGMEGNATLADGTMVLSLKLKVLDLTDKDFWRDDEEEIYKQMRVYDQTEQDSTKKEQYLYDYLYTKYEDGSVGKRDVIVDFRVNKTNGGGWLVADDNELNAYLLYENGTDMVEYVESCYDTWLMQTEQREQQEEVQRQIDEEIKEQVSKEG